MRRRPGGQPWPEPEVRARPAEAREIPRTAASLTKAAEANGWTVTLAYARGTVADSHGEPGPVVDSVVLRATRAGIAVVGSWEDGRFRTGWVLVPNAGPVPIGAKAIRGVVCA